MAFFDQLAEGLSKVAKDISGRAQGISEQVKLRSKIRESQSLIEKTYTEIGRLFAEAHADDENSEFASQFSVIREAKAAIESLEEELKKLKKAETCPVCGAEVSKDAQFCPKCGAKIEREEAADETLEEEEPAAEKKTCSVCGEELEADAEFCTSCGAPVEKEAPEAEEIPEAGEDDFAEED